MKEVRSGGAPQGFLAAEATALTLMLLVAGGVADEGFVFSAVAVCGVGVAVGRAVRTAIVIVSVVDFFLSLSIWGSTSSVRIAG